MFTDSKGNARQKPGSFTHLLVFVLPLMMVALSENIMIFFDRVILSHYSLTSFNSVTLASQTIEIFQYVIWAIAGISEVFVARLYAHKRYKDLAIPSWQMIYFSLFCIPFIILLSLYSSNFILHGIYLEDARTYYQVMIYTVPLMGVIAALSGFFIGRGKFKLILISTITVNIINLALDFLLIFGFKHIIPPLGTLGAAISAVIGLSIQIVWLLCIYLNKENRQNYSTNKYTINLKYIKKCLKLSLPLAAGHAGEMVGWLVIIKLLSLTTTLNFVIISIGSTLYLLFAFVADGLFRGIVTMNSYYLQLNKKEVMSRSVKSSLIILSTVLGILAIPFTLFPKSILVLFNLNSSSPTWIHQIKFNLNFIWLYFVFFGIFWLISAVMVAKNRTKLIMYINVITMWVCAILPMYILTKDTLIKPNMIWILIDSYILIACLLIYYFAKYRQIS